MKRSLFLLLLPIAAFAQQPVGTVEAQNLTVRGAVTLNGNTAELRSGAQVSTAEQAANIKLARGGVLRICPHSSLQITTSPTGRELLIAVDSGAIETDYILAGSADSIMTPDFQLQLLGPGAFHYAFGVDHTDMCAKALPNSNASVIVTENLGSGTYQLRPGDNVRFKNATVANPETLNTSACGCPEQAVKSSPPELGFPEQQSQAAAQAMAKGSTPPSAPPIAGVPETTLAPDQTITQVSVPLAFKGVDMTPAPPPAPPVTDATLAQLPNLAQPEVQPPPKKRSTNWLKRFFGKLFH